MSEAFSIKRTLKYYQDIAAHKGVINCKVGCQGVDQGGTGGGQRRICQIKKSKVKSANHAKNH